MPKIGYGYALYTGSPSSQPSDISGLSLWLKADAGVTTEKFTYSYISQIVLSGGDGAGTYNASSVPGWNSQYNRPSNYSLGAINWLSQDNLFQLNTGLGSIQGDGVNWYIDQVGYTLPTIAGVGGGFEDANGAYDYSGSPQSFDFVRTSGDFSFTIGGTIANFDLNAYNFVTEENFGVIASCVNGVWTPSGITGSITQSPTQVPTGKVTISSVEISQITQWNDQSGNNKNALPESYNSSINVGDSNPTFVSSVVNNKPALYFDGTKYLKTANIFSGSNPRSMFVVYYINDILSINVVCGIANESSPDAGTYFAIQARSDQNSNPYFSSNTYDLTGPAFQSNIWKLASADYDGITTNLYSNGSIANSGAMSLNTATSSFYIGCDYYQPAPPTRSYYGGYICEILVYNKALSKTERQQVEGYLNAKYAIY